MNSRNDLQFSGHQLGRITGLDTQLIVVELEAERDRLDRAIAALQGTSRGRGRPARAMGFLGGGRRRLSAAARKKIAAAAKRRWANAKAAGRNSL